MVKKQETEWRRDLDKQGIIRWKLGATIKACKQWCLNFKKG